MEFKQLFDNPPFGNYVTVDLDFWFEYFIRPKSEVPEGELHGFTRYTIQERITELENVIQESIYAEYRRSSSGNVHLRLIFPHRISVMDGFLIRSILFDDLTRNSLDMARYALWHSLNEIHKCFDRKGMAADSTKVAGPWIPMTKGRDDLEGEAKDDWEKYWDSIGRQYHKPESHRALILKHWKELSLEEKQELLKVLEKEATTKQISLNVGNGKTQVVTISTEKEKICGSKTQYSNRKKANDAKRNIEISNANKRKFGIADNKNFGALNVYLCPFCGYWHIGHYTNKSPVVKK